MRRKVYCTIGGIRCPQAARAYEETGLSKAPMNTVVIVPESCVHKVEHIVGMNGILIVVPNGQEFCPAQIDGLIKSIRKGSGY